MVRKRSSISTVSLSFFYIAVISISKSSIFVRRVSALVNDVPISPPKSICRRRFTTTKLIYQKNEYEPSVIPTTTSLFSSSPPSKEEVDPGIVEGTDGTGYSIVRYPHPSLRAENAEVILPDEQESITKLAKDMLKIMYAAQGVGLAAPQINVNKRIMVYNPTGDSKKWLDETILINPKIVEYSQAEDEAIEGCLSFPDMQGEVIRSKWIKVEAMTPKGRKIKKKFKGWEARIFQHEYDHLDGTVYIDRLSDETKTEVQGRLNELIEEYDGDNASL